MPIIKIDTGRSSTKVGRYLAMDRTGAERSEYFLSNTAAENVKEAELQFRATSEAYGKTEGRQFFQAYISFQRNDLGSLANPDGTPNWERIGDYGKEWAERFGMAQRHEFYVVAHGDKPHPHIHVVWNAAPTRMAGSSGSTESRTWSVPGTSTTSLRATMALFASSTGTATLKERRTRSSGTRNEEPRATPGRWTFKTG